MKIHKSELYHMRGSGVGSIFSALFRNLVPLVGTLFNLGKNITRTKTGRKVVKAAKRTAVQAGLDVAKDVLDGQNVVKTLKRRGKEASKNLLSALDDEGGGAVLSAEPSWLLL